MIHIVLATAEPRGSRPFQIIDQSGRKLPELMEFNPATKRHEVSIPLHRYKEIAKTVALGGKWPSNVTYVADVVEDHVQIPLPSELPPDGNPLFTGDFVDVKPIAALQNIEFIDNQRPSLVGDPSTPRPIKPDKKKKAKPTPSKPKELNAKSPFFLLRKVAQTEGAPWEGMNNAALFDSICVHRAQLATA